MSKQVTIKIHISRDFSFAEFDAVFDPETGEGLPSHEDLCRIYEMLPAKESQANNTPKKDPQQAAPKQAAKPERGRQLPATANQRRVLERYGEWEEGMTRSEASKLLSELGF